MVRYRVNVLYHLLAKIGKEPNADLFQFMKGDSHQRTEEEIKFVFERLGFLELFSAVRGPRSSSTCSCTHFQSYIKPFDPQPLAQCLYIRGQYINQEK